MGELATKSQGIEAIPGRNAFTAQETSQPPRRRRLGRAAQGVLEKIRERIEKLKPQKKETEAIQQQETAPKTLEKNVPLTADAIVQEISGGKTTLEVLTDFVCDAGQKTGEQPAAPSHIAHLAQYHLGNFPNDLTRREEEEEENGKREISPLQQQIAHELDELDAPQILAHYPLYREGLHLNKIVEQLTLENGLRARKGVDLAWQALTHAIAQKDEDAAQDAFEVFNIYTAKLAEQHLKWEHPHPFLWGDRLRKERPPHEMFAVYLPLPENLPSTKPDAKNFQSQGEKLMEEGIAEVEKSHSWRRGWNAWTEGVGKGLRSAYE